MEDPEDLYRLVLGMENANFYNKIFFNASEIKDNEKFSRWSDAETKTLGLNGVPKLDLPDLEHFFRRSIKLANRRITIDEANRYSFFTPEE